jgi:hypothetical protein
LRITPAHSTILEYLKILATSAKQRLRKIGENAFKRIEEIEGSAQSNAPAEMQPTLQPGAQTESQSATFADKDADNLSTGPFMFIFDNM